MERSSKKTDRFLPEVEDGACEEGLSFPKQELHIDPTEEQHAHAQIDAKHDVIGL